MSSLCAQQSNQKLFSIEGEKTIETIQYYGDFHLSKSHHHRLEQFDVDPGLAPEGDYMGNSCFTPDGQKILLTNRITDVLTIYDWSTMDVLANIELGEYPSCVGANNDYAIIGCQFSDSVYFLNLSDYTVIAALPTDEQPCSIEMSPDGSIAYVACDIDNTCMAFDMNSQLFIDKIENFPIYLNTFAFAVYVNRGWEKYNGFKVLPPGDRIAITNPDGSVDFFSTNTFSYLESISINSPRAIGFSGDGNYLACVNNPDNQCSVYQIDLSTTQITDTVDITGYGLGTNAIVVNQDGSKAYVGTNNNTSTLVRFETDDFVTFNSTYTAFWLGVSHDHLYAVSGQNRFSIINFETEEIEDQYLGLNQYFGAVSPVAYHVAGYDPLRFEGIYFFDFSTPDLIDYRGYMLAGEDPEGDTPGKVAISNDGTTALVAGNLSYNVPVLDLQSMQALTAVPVEESCYDVAVTPDGAWGIAGGYNNKTVKIIDLSDNSLAKTIFTGDRPMIVEMAPDGQQAYIGNIKSNTLTVLDLDGANSSVVTTKACGVIGVYTGYFGIRSAVRVSPDGNTVLVTASFDDELRVFDTEINEFVASLSTGDFPLDVAFDDESKTACVVNTFDATYDIVSVDGANTTIVHHKSLNADYPVDVAYNSVDGHFYICSGSSSKIFKIEATSGDVVETINTIGAPFHIDFYSGIPLIQIQGGNGIDHKIIYDDIEFILPYSSAAFTLNDNAGILGVPSPGPDLVSIIELGPSPFISEKNSAAELKIYPNPAKDRIYVDSKINFDQIDILDTHGRILHTFKEHAANGLDLSDLSRGTYIVRFSADKTLYSKVLLIQ
jgi:YVTN family beta-propeller protein